MSNSENNIIVLFGGAGFIGKELIESFGENNIVFVIDLVDESEKFLNTYINKMVYNFINLPPHLINIHMDLYLESLIENDNFNPKLQRILDSISGGFKSLYLYNLASPVGVVNHKEPTFYKAMGINQNIYKFCKKLYYSNYISANDYERLFFNFMSTSELYGEINKFPSNGIELDTFYKKLNSINDENYRSDYIYQKALGEALFSKLQGLYKVNIFRLFNIVGKYQDPKKGVFNKFVENIYSEKNCLVTESIRCYTNSNNFIRVVNDANNNANLKEFNIINVVDQDLSNSMTGEELYLYIYAYINKNIKPVVPNYTVADFSGEIAMRGSHNTLSYKNFCAEFGNIIDEVCKNLEYKENSKL